MVDEEVVAREVVAREGVEKEMVARDVVKKEEVKVVDLEVRAIQVGMVEERADRHNKIRIHSMFGHLLQNNYMCRMWWCILLYNMSVTWSLDAIHNIHLIDLFLDYYFPRNMN